MRKNLKIILAICIVAIAISLVYGKYSNKADNNKNQQESQSTTIDNSGNNDITSSEKTQEDNKENDKKDNDTEEKDKIDNEEKVAKEPIDLSVIKPNEAGKIMVVMFHNFIEEYKSGDKEYTTTFKDFRKLLQTLYDSNYRLISLNDYLDGNIAIAAGCIPMVFTFDDGTSGQFSLIEEQGKLVVNPDSAVGVLEEFNKANPDFGLEGTFYVNLGLGTFEGKGTLSQRLEYLVEKGFEIGNHTLNHIMLSTTKSADKIQQEIGGNYKKMLELVPGYKMTTFSLPYGLPSSELQGYVVKGTYEEVEYENRAILEVGWDPTLSPVSKKFDPLSTHRVRASGIEPVDADLAWWLKNLSVGEQYVSDGDPDTITVPKDKEDLVDREKLKGRDLIVY